MIRNFVKIFLMFLVCQSFVYEAACEESSNETAAIQLLKRRIQVPPSVVSVVKDIEERMEKGEAAASVLADLDANGRYAEQLALPLERRPEWSPLYRLIKNRSDLVVIWLACRYPDIVQPVLLRRSLMLTTHPEGRGRSLSLSCLKASAFLPSPSAETYAAFLSYLDPRNLSLSASTFADISSWKQGEAVVRALAGSEKSRADWDGVYSALCQIRTPQAASCVFALLNELALLRAPVLREYIGSGIHENSSENGLLVELEELQYQRHRPEMLETLISMHRSHGDTCPILARIILNSADLAPFRLDPFRSFPSYHSQPQDVRLAIAALLESLRLYPGRAPLSEEDSLTAQAIVEELRAGKPDPRSWSEQNP